MVHAHVFATRTPMNYNTALSTLAGINQSGGYGFTNWRLPSWDEATRGIARSRVHVWRMSRRTMLNLWMRGKAGISGVPLRSITAGAIAALDVLDRFAESDASVLLLRRRRRHGVRQRHVRSRAAVRYLGAGEFYFYDDPGLKDTFAVRPCSSRAPRRHRQSDGVTARR
jgi:hypothetical protein